MVQGLTEGPSVQALSDYIDALVEEEYPEEEKFLEFAPPVDREELKKLFVIARGVRDSFLGLSTPAEDVKEKVWARVEVYLKASTPGS